MRGVISHEDVAAHLAEVRSKPSVVAALDNQPILVAESDSALVGWVEFGDVAIPEVDVRPGDQELRRNQRIRPGSEAIAEPWRTSGSHHLSAGGGQSSAGDSRRPGNSSPGSPVLGFRMRPCAGCAS